MALSHREIKLRDERIYQLRKEESPPYSINDLAKEFDLTPQRIFQILQKGKNAGKSKN